MSTSSGRFPRPRSRARFQSATPRWSKRRLRRRQPDANNGGSVSSVVCCQSYRGSAPDIRGAFILIRLLRDRYSSGATGTIVVGGRGSVLAVADEVLAAAAGVAALALEEVAAADAAAAAGGRGRIGAGGASGTASAGAVAAADGGAPGV